jgi:cytochrome P450
VTGLRALHDLPGLLAASARRFGTRWLLRAPDRDWLVSAEPDDAHSLASADPQAVLAGAANASLEPIGGSSSVVALDAPEHLRVRRLLLPPLHGERLRAYRREMEDLTDEMIESWTPGSVVNLYAEAKRLTFRVISRTVLGIEDPVRAEEALSRFQQLFGGAALVIYLPALQRDLGPLSPWRRFLARRERADEVVYREIHERLADGGAHERRDVLSLLTQARYDDGSPLSAAELRDQVVTLLLAGHETTAAGIAWTIDALLRQRDALDRLVRELDAGDSAYLDAVVREGLRYRPPVPLFGRVMASPWRLGPYEVPAGVGVLIDSWTLQRRADLYEQPDTFRPERFIESEIAPSAYLPFGTGVRRCLGAAFAEQELRVAIGRLVSRCTLDLVDDRDEGFRLRGVTLVPSRGVRVRVGDRPR